MIGPVLVHVLEHNKGQMENILFVTEKEYRRTKCIDLEKANVIVVDGIIVKNRFGPDGILYKGSFGYCNRCKADILIRDSLSETFVGCLC